MSKTVEIKDDLIREVMEITGAATEREAIERAVESYLAQHRKSRPRKSMFDLVGEVRLRDDYDYKVLREAGKHTDLLGLMGKIRFRDDYDPRSVRFSGHDDD